jgi:hypothetical protein
MLETLGLEPSLQDTADEYLDFSGKTVKSSATVDIPWCSAEGSRKIRTNTFRVAQAAPFSVILGSELLFPEGIMTFNKTAWVLGKKPATKGKGKLPTWQRKPLKTSRRWHINTEEKEYMDQVRERAIKETKALAVRKKKERVAKAASGSCTTPQKK